MSLSNPPVEEAEEKQRRLRQVQCGSKRPYSKGGAKRAFRAVKAAGQTGLNIYRCPWCDHWHLGRKTIRQND